MVKAVVCLEELKMELIARNCLTPGLVPLVGNLLKSAEEDIGINSQGWINHYKHGLKQEIHSFSLSSFSGHPLYIIIQVCYFFFIMTFYS